MSKIPVGATIAQGYNFGFARFFTLLKLMWLPLAIMLASHYFLIPLLMGVMAPAQNAAAGGAWLLIPLYLIILIMMSAQFVAIAQYALGLKPEPGRLTLPLDKPVWRLIGAFVLVLLIMIGVMIVAGLLISGIVAALAALAKPAPVVFVGLMTGIVMMFLYGAFIYGMVRLMFLLTPVVVAESKIGIGRSWKLGRGNFWRMFMVLLAIFLPLLVVEVVALWLLPGFPPMQPGAPEQFRAAMQAWEVNLLGRMNSYWYIVYPLFGVFMVVFYGILIGAQCFAYRALVPAETEADVFS
jgi:hypothetical protein